MSKLIDIAAEKNMFTTDAAQLVEAGKAAADKDPALSLKLQALEAAIAAIMAKPDEYWEAIRFLDREGWNGNSRDAIAREMKAQA